MHTYTETELEKEIVRVLDILDNLWATPRVQGVGAMIEMYEEYSDELMRMYYKGAYTEESI